ncbi:hypothetical protein D9619_013004 [Psilocybe cf. subviscida]|uniref:Uncharacterized protein n=1 Tax=Psilocybe cf. subviscida TaxID=2480587 RepID=A0A8H5EVK1_9AGAR|nr:hypothetical protein D9619_013004 [Psilocybe cf. subviscida]
MTKPRSLHADLSNAFKNCFELSIKKNIQIASTNNVANQEVPNEHTIKKAFRSVLKKWRDGKYTPLNPAIPLIAYVLPGGNESDATRGLEGLTEKGASIVNSLAPIAKVLGFSVFTASLTKKVVGIPHEDDFTYEFIPSHYKRRRLGFDNDTYDLYCEIRGHGDYDIPPMGEVLEEKQFLDYLAGVDDANALSMKLGAFDIEEDSHIARKNEFGKSYPQEEYFDRDDGEITLEHHRCVVVLCPHQEETDLILALKGPYWFLKQLEVTSTPSARSRAVVSAAIKNLDAKEAGIRVEWSNFKDETSSSSTATRILAHATAWKDHTL